MRIIWQEFWAIMSDAWDIVAKAVGWMMVKGKWLLGEIVANYPVIIVLIIGLPISGFMVFVPFIGALDLIFQPLRNAFDPQPRGPAIQGNLIEFILMFGLGLCIFFFTVDLSDRISKRLEGKPKDDQTDSPSTESEA